jgi:type I restriction enzyme, S subunit
MNGLAQTCRLGDVCEVRRGTMITEEQTAPGNIPVVAGGMAPTYFHAESNRVPGAVTISGSGANSGYVAVWDETIWASDCTTVEPGCCGLVDGRFIYHQLKYMESRIQATLRRGAAQPHVYARDIAELEVAVPSMEEQRRIAAVLDAADALKTKRRRALAKLDTLTQAICASAYADHGSPEPLGGHIAFLTSGARGWSKYYSDTGSRFVRSLDVQMNAISDQEVVYVNAPCSAEARRIKVRSGDVLLTITGSRIGRVAKAPPLLDGGYISQHVAIVRVDGSTLLPGYLALWLAHPSHGQRQIALKQYGQTKPGLNFDQIKSFELPVPSIEAQLALVEAVERVGCIVTAGQRSAASLDSIAASLKQRAFRREL